METRQNRLIEAILVGVRNPRNGKKKIYTKFSTTVKIASISEFTVPAVILIFVLHSSRSKFIRSKTAAG